jgi:hypothetical protein
MTDIIKREMTARLASIEDELTEFPANIRAARERFNALRDVLYITQSVQRDGGSPEVVALLMESAIRQSYRLADCLSALARLELTASDYSVLMAMARSEAEEKDLIEGETAKTHVSVYPIGENVA